MNPKIKVMVADDHSVIRAGLVSVLRSQSDMEVVAEAENGQQVIEKALKLKPDVIIIDIYMPFHSGLEATIMIKERLPETKIIIFTISENERDVFQSLRVGADGYILKETDVIEIPNVIRNVMKGRTMLSPLIATKLVNEFRNKSSETSLSTREAEVMELLAKGLKNNQIAEQLFISEATVRTYINRLLNKLHLKNRSEAIAFGYQNKTNHKTKE
jgi:DNA-binding NarL/FixJ family response regulator